MTDKSSAENNNDQKKAASDTAPSPQQTQGDKKDVGKPTPEQQK